MKTIEGKQIMANFTPNFTRPETVKPGSYQAMLKDVCDCQMAVWEGDVKTDVIEPGLRFIFLVDDGSGQDKELAVDARKKIGPKSNLYKMLQGMLGTKFKPEILQDNLRTAKAINWLVGRFFILSCETKPSGYTKVVTVTAMPDAPVKTMTKPAVVESDEPQPIQPLPKKTEQLTGFEGLPDVVPEADVF